MLVCQEERLLRELLPSSPTITCQSPQLHHSHSAEQWLVSSETKKPLTEDAAESDCLHERAKLQEVLQDQLSQQLQQQHATAEMLQQKLEQQQQTNTVLQHQLEQSHLKAEELQRLLETQNMELAEVHHRAQLQDLLTQQLQSQLLEVSEQRHELGKREQQWEQQMIMPSTMGREGLMEVRSATQQMP